MISLFYRYRVWNPIPEVLRNISVKYRAQGEIEMIPFWIDVLFSKWDKTWTFF